MSALEPSGLPPRPVKRIDPGIGRNKGDISNPFASSVHMQQLINRGSGLVCLSIQHVLSKILVQGSAVS